MDVNVRGYFFMSAAAVKLMATHGGGAIVNVASVNGVVPGMLQGVYSVTKAAVIGMTKSFARECAPLGVRVNALLPGLTRTKLAGALLEGETGEKWSAHIPMARPAEPDEMAGAVLYLVSPAASYTTGVALKRGRWVPGFLTRSLRARGPRRPPSECNKGSIVPPWRGCYDLLHEPHCYAPAGARLLSTIGGIHDEPQTANCSIELCVGVVRVAWRRAGHGGSLHFHEIASTGANPKSGIQY